VRNSGFPARRGAVRSLAKELQTRMSVQRRNLLDADLPVGEEEYLVILPVFASAVKNGLTTAQHCAIVESGWLMNPAVGPRKL